MKNKIREHKFVFILLLIIFAGAIFVRLFHFSSTWFFGYEQGRDALVAQSILLGRDFKLVGPKTDIDNIYHGGGYYYVLALMYALVVGNPLYVGVLAVIFQSSVIFVIYYAAVILTGNKKISFIAPLFYAFSTGALLSARWLSNATLDLPLIALFFLFVILLVQKKDPCYWVPLGILTGLMYHFQILHLLYAGWILILLLIAFKVPFRSRYFVFAIVCGMAIVSTFLTFEIKSHFVQTHAILGHIHEMKAQTNIFSRISIFAHEWLYEVQYTLLPQSGAVVLILIVGLLGAVVVKARKIDSNLWLLLLFSLWALPAFFLYSKDGLHQIYIGSSIGIILLCTYLLSRLEGQLRVGVWIVPVLFISCNLSYSYMLFSENNAIYYNSFEPQIGYNDKFAVVKKIYAVAPGQFSIDAFTMPYGQHEAWEYLFQWYGRSLNKEISQKYAPGFSERRYMIYPSQPVGGHFLLWTREVNKVYVPVTTFKIGPYVVEERKK